MNLRSLWLLFVLALNPVGVLQADNPIFSGPQIGEKLPPFKVRGVEETGHLRREQADARL